MGFPLRSEFVRLWRNPPETHSQSALQTLGAALPSVPPNPPAVRGGMDPSAAACARGEAAASLAEHKPWRRGSTRSSALPGWRPQPGDAREEACRASPLPTFARCPHPIQRSRRSSPELSQCWQQRLLPLPRGGDRPSFSNPWLQASLGRASTRIQAKVLGPQQPYARTSRTLRFLPNMIFL